MAKKTTLARALTHLPHFGASCNDLIEASPEVIAGLAKEGHVDAKPEAVAYAKSQNARVVTLNDEGTGPAPAADAAADAKGDDNKATA